MGFVSLLKGKIDSNNSSATPLGISGVFTGAAVNISQFGVIFVNVFSDVASATDGLMIQQSVDGINWDHDDVYTVPAGTGKNYSINPYANFFRIVYTNGAVEQATFRLQVVLKNVASKYSSHRIQDSIVDEDDAELVKSVLSGQSDIDGSFENVSTYREALQIDAALVHRVGISEHTRRTIGAATTLDVPASSGDTVINVAATTGFIVGDLVILYNTTITERGHFHLTAVDPGVSVTLNRPIDNDLEIGDHMDEVQIGMNQIGSLASPLSFRVTPIGSERFQITRILTTMLDSSAMDDGKFGGLAELTNGVIIRVCNDGVIRTLTHWRSNADLKDDMYDVTYSDKAPAGQFGLSSRWTFTKGEFVVDLDGATGDYFEILIQDDLTDLDDFEVKAQGRLFGS